MTFAGKMPAPNENCLLKKNYKMIVLAPMFSEKTNRCSRFLLTVFFLLCLGSFTPLHAKVFEANDFASLKVAVDAVNKGSGGDTIKITGNIVLEGDGGSYSSADIEKITRNFTITAETNPDGTPKYTIDGGNYSFEVSTSSVKHAVFENLKITNTRFLRITAYEKNRDASVVLNNCIFTNNNGGLSIDCNGKITLTNSTSSDNVDISSSGFSLWDTNECIIENCVAMNNGATGFRLSGSENARVYINNCVAMNNGGTGFACNGTDAGVYFNNCEATGNDIGITIHDVSCIINNCSVTGNIYGISVVDWSNNVNESIICNTTLSNNKVGISLGNAYHTGATCKLINCTVTQNKRGIEHSRAQGTSPNMLISKVFNSIVYGNEFDTEWCYYDGHYNGCADLFSIAYIDYPEDENAKLILSRTIYETELTNVTYEYSQETPKEIEKHNCITNDPKLLGRTAAGNPTNNPDEIVYYDLDEGSSALQFADRNLITVEELTTFHPDLPSEVEIWLKSMITAEFVAKILMYDQLGNIRQFNGNMYDAGAIAANKGAGGTSIILSYNPQKTGNFGKSTITFFGHNLDNNTKITLKKQGESDIVAQTIKSEYSATTKLFKCLATFDFHNKKTGKWDIVVTVGDTATETIKNGFEIEEYVEPFIETEILGPANLSPNKWVDYTVIITNKGNVDIFWVPVIIGITTDTLWVKKVEIKRKWDEIKPKDVDVTEIPETKTIPTPEGDGRQTTYIPPIIPTIPAKSKVSIKFSVKMTMPQNNSASTALKAEAFKPMNKNSLDDNSLDINPEFFECLEKMMDIVKRAGMEVVSTFVPGAGCAISMGTTAQSAMENYENKGIVDAAGNLVYDFGRMVIGCAGGAIPGSQVAEAAWGYIEGMGKVESWASRAGLLGEWLSTYNDCKNASLFNGKIVTSVDPNDKYGPVSSSGSKAFSDRTEFTYVINFENDPEKATAPAQEVWIVDTLDLKVFDINTFEAGFLDIGGRLIETPFGQQDCAWTVDMNPEMDLTTEVNLTLDKAKGIAKWYFKSIDPATGELPVDAMMGFLPPNDSTGRGQGSVFFTIKLKNGLADDVVVANRASIIFDTNAPILTPIWENKKDVVPPSSTMLRPTTVNDTLVTLKWQGTDNPGGSGVYCYDIYMKKENGNYEHFTSTFQTSAPFTIKKDVKYSLYSIATDSAGNREANKTKPDITIPEVNLPFDEYAATKWNNTFMLNLKKLKEEGYEVTACKWFKNSAFIGDGFSYSAGPQITDRLETGAVYYFQLTTSSHGEVYSTNKIIVGNPQSGLKAYPNPAPQGSKLIIEGTVQGAMVEVFNYMGLCVSRTVATDFTTEITLSLPAGVYIVRSNNEAVKVIVN